VRPSAFCDPDVYRECHSASSHRICFQAVMLSHTTLSLYAFLQRHWRKLHSVIKMDFSRRVGAVDWMKMAQNRDQQPVLLPKVTKYNLHKIRGRS
jgi:hypothetical protein